MVTITILSGAMTALVGLAFGLPSLRIKGFYLAVATLARAVFSRSGFFNKVPWFLQLTRLGPDRRADPIALRRGRHRCRTPRVGVKYLLLFRLPFFVLAWIARNLTRGSMGRQMDGDPRHGHRAEKSSG